MIDWARTSPIVANLYNPAFLGELIRRVGEAYRKECARDLPLALSFLAIPLVIYPDSRGTLKARSYRYLHSWAIDNPQIRVHFARRCGELAPYIRLALAFAVAHRAIAIAPGGGLRPLRRPRGASVPALETSDYFVACQTIGRWLARVEIESNIFIMLGVGL